MAPCKMYCAERKTTAAGNGQGGKRQVGLEMPSLWYGKAVTAKSWMRKVRDERSTVSCMSGVGIVREEVWEDAKGQVVRYNLTFINQFLMKTDHGRVLGYDNAHGLHHRHFRGTVAPCEFESYEATLERFIREVQELRREKP